MDARKNAVQRPVLILFRGLPGSGKTSVARERERETGAIRISTDEWMADLELRNAIETHGTVPISKAILEESWHRLQRPDEAELSLFDRTLVHGQASASSDGCDMSRGADDRRPGD